MKFIDLKIQYEKIENEINSKILAVLQHGQYILGPEVQELEKALADYVGVKNCIAVSSGTDALLISLMALGVTAGHEVITTPFTFIATGETIALLGAKPVFVDIDPRTYNINPDLIERAITEKTKAILPVNLYGQCCDYERINKVAQKYDLPVVEDAAQSFGATSKGKKSCSLSTIGCTSFFPSKPLGCYGDGGACFTNDDKLAVAIRQISVHGQDRRYHHSRIGVNGRMDTIQAAVLLVKLKLFREEVQKRIFLGTKYSSLLDVEGVSVPFVEDYNTSVYAQYTIQVSDREQLQKDLSGKNIPTAVHYPIPLHKQPVIDQAALSLPVVENAAQKVLSLPMHPYLPEEAQQIITDAILDFV